MAAYCLNLWEVAQAVLEVALELCTPLCRMQDQAFFLDNIQHRTSHSTYERISTKGTAMASWCEKIGSNAGCQASANRQAIGKRFGECNDVGLDAFMLIGELGTCTTHAALNFIQHEQPAVARAMRT